MNERSPSYWELAVEATTNTRQGYNLLAPRFEATGYATPAFWVEACARRVEALFPLDPEHARGADLACGTGRGLFTLRQSCRQWDGYDFSPGMLKQARKRIGPDPEVDLIESDLAALELPEGAYDRVVTFGAWGHILAPWRSRLFEQIVRSLRPDGVFYTITADRASPWNPEGWAASFFDLAIGVRNRLLGDPFHMYYRLNDTGTVRRLFEEMGGVRVQLEPVPGSPHRRLTLLMVSRIPTARRPGERRRRPRSKPETREPESP